MVSPKLRHLGSSTLKFSMVNLKTGFRFMYVLFDTRVWSEFDFIKFLPQVV
jgi:hypothetical protein